MIDVLHHVFAIHTDASVGDGQSVDAKQVVSNPINIPHDLALLVGQFLDGFDGVLRQFAQELEVIAVHAESIKHESGVGNLKRKSAAAFGRRSH